MKKRWLGLIAAVTAAALAASAAPAFTADTGTVAVTVTAQAAATPCITVAPTTLDFGTLPFSTAGTRSTRFIGGAGDQPDRHELRNGRPDHDARHLERERHGRVLDTVRRSCRDESMRPAPGSRQLQHHRLPRGCDANQEHPAHDDAGRVLQAGGGALYGQAPAPRTTSASSSTCRARARTARARRSR